MRGKRRSGLVLIKVKSRLRLLKMAVARPKHSAARPNPLGSSESRPNFSDRVKLGRSSFSS